MTSNGGGGNKRGGRRGDGRPDSGRAEREAASVIHQLAERITALERTNQLERGSVTNNLDVYDDDDQLVQQIGQQWDGTFNPTVLLGPEPPIPTPPILLPGLRSVTVHWDGEWEPEYEEDGVTILDDQVVAPMDFARVEIHASTDPEFEPESIATLVGTYETPRGGDQMIPVPTTGEDYTIKFVARTLSGARGDASDGAIVQADDVETSDGIPPTETVVPIAIGQIQGVYLAWDGIDNPDPVVYRIYAHTTNLVPVDNDHLIGEVAGTAFLARVVDHNPLTTVPYNTDSYFRVVAVDADGVGPHGPVVNARAIRADSNDLADDIITLAHLGLDTEEFLDSIQSDALAAAAAAAAAQADAEQALADAADAAAIADGKVESYFQTTPPDYAVQRYLNRAYNPRAVASYGAEYLARLTGWVQSWVTGVTGPLGITTAARFTTAGGDTGATRGHDIYGSMGSANPGTTGNWILQPVTPGEPLTISEYGRWPVATAHRASVRFHNGAGAWVGAQILGAQVTAPADTWVRAHVSTIVPAGATHVVARVDNALSAVFPAGAVVDVTGLMVETASEPSPYFDATFADTALHTYGWVGVANQSMGARYPAGAIGDLWFDTDDGNKLYRWSGDTWVLAADQGILDAADAAALAQATADGKITTFYQTNPPTATGVGDLWVDTNDQNRLYRAMVVGANEIGPTEWVDIRDTAIAAASASAAAAQLEAANALSAAQMAQAIADGSIRTYYQSAPPDLSDLTNLITNPSFEVNTTGWTNLGTGTTVTRVTSDFYTGSASAEVTTPGTVAGEGIQLTGTDLPVSGGATYSGRARFKAPAGRPMRVRFIETVGGTGVTDVDVTATGGWQEVTLTRAASAAATAMDVRVLYQSTAGPIAGTFWVDSVMVTRTDAPVAYFDGATAAGGGYSYGWSGTAHLSTSKRYPDAVLGDMWFDVDDGQAYRWNGTTWQIIEDSSIAAALAAAQNAQSTADGKITSYYGAASPWPNGAGGHENDIGDLWWDTDDNNKPYYWNGSTWVVIRDGTISLAQAQADAAWNASQTALSNAAAAQSVADNALAAAGDAQATADGKVATHFVTTAPTGLTAADVGDLWFDTDDGYKMYRWSGSAWVVSADDRISQALLDAAAAQQAAENSMLQGNYIANPLFDNWPSGNAVPTSYIGSVGTPIRELAIVRTLPTALRYNVAAGGNNWMRQRLTIPNTEYITVSMDAYLVSGDFSGAGALLGWMNTVPAGYYTPWTFHTDVPTPTVGKWYRFTKTLRRPTTFTGTYDALDAYVVGGHATLGTITAKDVVFDAFLVRPASVAEIQAYNSASATSVQLLADTVATKITTFYQAAPPVSAAIGDLWVDTDDGNRLYRAASIGADAVAAGEWVDVRDTTIAAASSAAAAAQQAADNALTAAQVAQAIADGSIRTYYQSAAPDQSDLTNLIVNPSFEVDAAKWQSAQTATLARVADPMGLDSWALAFTNSAAVNGNYAVGTLSTVADRHPVTPGKSYVASGYMRAATVGRTVRAEINFLDAAGAQIGSISIGATMTDSTTANVRPFVTFVAPANAVTSRTFFRVLAAEPGEVHYLNRVMFHEGTAPINYFDGTTAAAGGYSYSWSGTAHLSTSKRYPDAVLGDLWYDVDDGQAYRWNGSSWQIIEDASIAAALAAAQNAQTTADGKITSYYLPDPPWANANATHDLDVGDLWFETDNGNKPYYWHSNRTWTALPIGLPGLGGDVNARALGAIVTTVAPTAPSGAKIVGDLWMDSDDGNKLWRWNGSIWVAVQDQGIADALAAAAAAANLADAKMRIFFEPKHASGMYPASNPAMVATDTGDIWFRTDEGNRPYRYDGSVWTAFIFGSQGLGGDGVAPTTSPTPTITPGIRSVFLRWTALTNPDPVVYRVYGSKTNPFTADVNTYIGETAGTAMTVNRLPGVETPTFNPAITPAEDAYFRIIATDVYDGPAPAGTIVAGRARALDGGDIGFESVTADHIGVGTIVGTLFSGTIVLGSRISTGSIDDVETSPTYGQVVGQRVDLSPAGLELINPAGEPLIHFPTDPNDVAYVNARLDTGELRVRGGASFETTANEIAKDAGLLLSMGTSAPVSSPTQNYEYDTVQFQRVSAAPPGGFGEFSLLYSQIDFVGRNNITGLWVVAQKRNAGIRLWWYEASGAPALSGGVPRCVDLWNASSMMGVWGYTGSVGTGYAYRTDTSAFYFVVKRTDTDVYVVNELPATLDWELTPQVTWDEAGARILVMFNDYGFPDREVRIERYTTNNSGGSMTFTSATMSGLGVSNHRQPIGFCFGNFDMGAARYVWGWKADGTNVAVSAMANAGMDTTKRFPPAVPLMGLVWDGANFWSAGADGFVYKHTNWTWTDTNDYVHSGLTWYDDDTAGTVTPPSNDGRHETSLGPINTLKMRKRAKLRVTLPQVPDLGGVDDPNKWRFYASRGTVTKPAATTLIYQTEGGSPTAPTTLLFSALGTVDTRRPPATSNFPNANPGYIKSAFNNPTTLREVFKVDGGGGGWWDRIAPPGSITMYARDTVLMASLVLPEIVPGWLICRGDVVSRSAYPALFAVVGTAFNTGGEAGTDFRLPDFQRRLPFGVAPAATGNVMALGQTEAGVITTRTLGHRHGIVAANMTIATNTATTGTAQRVVNGQTHDHGGFTDTNAGADMLPHMGMNFIIKY